MNSPLKTLIVGIGSAHGDDQIGWMVADEVCAMLADSSAKRSTQVQKAKSPFDWLNWLGEHGGDSHQLFLCDACHGFGNPGSIGRWNWPDCELEKLQFSGTHDFGLAAVLHLAQQLGRLPDAVAIWGIQVESIRPNSRLSKSLRSIPSILAQEIICRIHEPEPKVRCASVHSTNPEWSRRFPLSR